MTKLGVDRIEKCLREIEEPSKVLAKVFPIHEHMSAEVEEGQRKELACNCSS
jgi:hypothetical protein